MDNFRSYYNLGNLNFDDLEYENACQSDAVHEVLGALSGVDWSSNIVTVAPIGAVLRVAEGLDSIRNLFMSGMDLPTEAERGAVILCGLSQLGGLLFSLLALIITLSLCVCAPFGSALALFLYRLMTQTEESAEARDKEQNDFMDKTDISSGSASMSRGKRNVLILPENERLLPITVS